ncbi:MAG: MmcQ/YjbR family DNA-binding protein [Clostridia bacterium]|nr:MmcQ/YjbR family DNA-binding protein [Clostridia bacterium]
MTEKIFEHHKVDPNRLIAFGFERQNHDYFYHRDLLDGQMKLTVTVTAQGDASARVIDAVTEEEYVLHRVPDACGRFVGQVRDAYDKMLAEIVEACFDPAVFKAHQTEQIIAYVREKYGDVLEFLWQKFPNNAVFRRKDNRKWYAAILTVSRRKLGFDSDEHLEIIDLRMSSEKIETDVDGVRILPGYHMNKKHWVTVCLDGSVPLCEICQMIDASYELARK